MGTMVSAVERGRCLCSFSCLAYLLAALLLCHQTTSVQAVDCVKTFGGKSVTVLMVADPGSYSGNAEAEHYLLNLKNNKSMVSFVRGACVGAYTGKIMGLPVVVATSGIGPTSAALCVTKLMQCDSVIKDLIYAGTSGWSSAIGGIINPSTAGPDASCSVPNAKVAKGQVTRLGDVCISPYGSNWACQQADWSAQCTGSPNLCADPGMFFGPDASFLYGKCIFSTAIKASLDLTHELLAATMTETYKSQVPIRSAEVHDKHDIEYWNITNTGLLSTGVSYHVYGPKDPPSIFNYTVCGEVDAQFFWSGAPWDVTGRKFTAQLINQALNTSVSALDVIAVSAMEAVGVGQAMEQHNDLKDRKNTPYTIVRGNSDYVHQPVVYEGNGMWKKGTSVVIDYALGYRYAIASYSAVVLSMMELRCKELASKGKLSADTCTFKIDYP